jgi:hypothetical protein
MTEFELQQWSSHKFIFDPLFSLLEFTTILELGAGMFSTEYLASHCDRLISLETDSDWYDEMEKVLPENAQMFLHEKDQVDDYIGYYYDEYLPRLVFVDHSGDRHRATRICMSLGVPYIVVHDFSFEDMAKIGGHGRYEVVHNIGKHFNPTACYTNNKQIANSLREIING